ncbi:MAG: peptidylprolyl isomerase [Gemmataceae bacterium]
MKQRFWIACGAGLLLVSMSLAQTAATRQAAKAVAVVNGVQISQGELDAVLKVAGPVAVHLPEAQRKQRQMECVAMLIDNVLMRQFLEKNTNPVAPAEIERRVAEMRTGLKEQGKSIEEFCQDTNQTIDQLRASISDYLRWNAYSAQHLRDAEVDNYYKENKDFFDGVTVRASHIVFRMLPNATEEDKAKARGTLQQIRQKLVSDPMADFGAYAKAYSQDPVASKGGDLGWIPRKWFDEAFSKAAFSLPVGQVSDVVQTEFGMHLIKVTERKAGKPSDYAKIKDAVREFCMEDMRQQILARLRKDAKITVNIP